MNLKSKKLYTCACYECGALLISDVHAKDFVQTLLDSNSFCLIKGKVYCFKCAYELLASSVPYEGML